MIKIIDLFAGIGGVRLAFETSAKKMGKSIKCVFTSEIDKFAVETYTANFGNHNIYGDITGIEESDIPDHDILLAGFPCQPFSSAGLKNGFTDTRGTLFFDIERILKKKKPKAFLLENVKHLKGHDKGRTLQTIIKHLEALNYKVFYKILNAKDYGLPQNRERIFIVGFRNHDVKFEFPEPLKTQTRVGSILESKVDSKYTISDLLWAGHQRRKIEHKEKGNGFGYGMFNAESKYTNTISARYYKDGSEVLIEQTNGNPRKLTPRECARLQGFPDEFIIPVSDTQAYRQFGNSVPVLTIQAVAKNILRALYESPNKKVPAQEEVSWKSVVNG